MNAFSPPRKRGSALLITLAFLVLVAILVVGLAETMRIERTSARTHLERTRAMDFAQMGVERMVGQLHSKLAYTNINWVSLPGQIISSGSGFGKLTNSVDLYSGITTNTTLVGTLHAPNLNAQILQDQTPGSYLITDRTKDPADPSSGIVELPLKWIYVRQDGSSSTAEPPELTNKLNPIVGRYAYWTDDESSKINYNLAWRRTATVPDGHPSKINLPSLPGMTEAYADIIHSSITSDNYAHISRLFNSPYDARRLDANISGVINSNKFDVTHYNHDPDSTFFNEPRIVLTTQEKYAPRDANGNILTDPATGAPYFLDILATENSDPGIVNTIPNQFDKIDSAKLNKTLALLVNYLRRTDWPMTSVPASLQEKYFSGDPSRLTELALNIIDYVRSKESKEPLVDPLRGNGTPPAFVLGNPTSAGYFGITRTPMINEAGIWLNPAGDQIKVKVELYLPPNYGIDSLDLTKGQTLFIYAINLSPPYNYESAAIENKILSTECSPSSTLTAGNYVTITKTLPISVGSPMVGAKRPTLMGMTPAFSRLHQVGRTDRAPMNAGEQINCTIDPVGVAEADITSTEVDDPRVNKKIADWKQRASGNSFGTQNSIWSVGSSPLNVSPQQDTDEFGMVSSASLYMPYPKGNAQNPDGLVASPGELGFICTGAKSSSGGTGVPWRTLRLQPNNYVDTKVVPDWAFMDLFTVPVEVTDPNDANYKAAAAATLQPHGTSIAGRININAQAQPFGNPNYFTPPMERIYPLKALFEGAPKDSSGNIFSPTDAVNLAGNIYNNVLAGGGKAYGNTNVFDSPGEVVEIKGVADRGEESEAAIRGIANVISARGNVFRIYSIGQSLKQTPAGNLVVNGEQRLQAIIERYLDNSSNTVKFRTVYFRNLTP